MNTSPEQRRFLHDAFYGMTLGATVQRARVYQAGTTDAQRLQFQASLQRQLRPLATDYRTSQSDETHLARIERLSEEVSTTCADALRGSRFRIGPAQKAINLYLKYLWCAGEIAMPPHCPFDYRVIHYLKLPVSVTWTDLDSISAYCELVAAARAAAGHLSLAEWELGLYNTVSEAARRAT